MKKTQLPEIWKTAHQFECISLLCSILGSNNDRGSLLWPFTSGIWPALCWTSSYHVRGFCSPRSFCPQRRSSVSGGIFLLPSTLVSHSHCWPESESPFVQHLFPLLKQECIGTSKVLRCCFLRFHCLSYLFCLLCLCFHCLRYLSGEAAFLYTFDEWSPSSHQMDL